MQCATVGRKSRIAPQQTDHPDYMKNPKQLSLSVRLNPRSPASSQSVTSSVTHNNSRICLAVKPGIAEMMRGVQAGKTWASATAATAEPWRIEALRLAIGQWEFDAEIRPHLPVGMPIFMSSGHFDGATLFAGEAAINAAQGKLSSEYMRGFAVGALSAWADMSAGE